MMFSRYNNFPQGHTADCVDFMRSALLDDLDELRVGQFPPGTFARWNTVARDARAIAPRGALAADPESDLAEWDRVFGTWLERLEEQVRNASGAQIVDYFTAVRGGMDACHRFEDD